MRWTWILPQGQGPGHRFMALIIKVLTAGKLIQDQGLEGPVLQREISQ